MLKIKDNVDLKELEKFGFEKFNDKGGLGLFHVGCGVPIMYGKMEIHKSMPHWLLFDLIQAGLVEKRESKWN